MPILQAYECQCGRALLVEVSSSVATGGSVVVLGALVDSGESLPLTGIGADVDVLLLLDTAVGSDDGGA